MAIVYCRDCVRYEEETQKCLDGKVNPQRYEQALAVSQVLGLRAICTFNDHRERLVSVKLGGRPPKSA